MLRASIHLQLCNQDPYKKQSLTWLLNQYYPILVVNQAFLTEFVFILDHHSDLIDKCRISLLVLKRFEGAVKDQAVGYNAFQNVVFSKFVSRQAPSWMGIGPNLGQRSLHKNLLLEPFSCSMILFFCIILDQKLILISMNKLQFQIATQFLFTS